MTGTEKPETGIENTDSGAGFPVPRPSFLFWFRL